MLCQSKVRWRFCKILWPSQNTYMNFNNVILNCTHPKLRKLLCRRRLKWNNLLWPQKLHPVLNCYWQDCRKNKRWGHQNRVPMRKKSAFQLSTTSGHPLIFPTIINKIKGQGLKRLFCRKNKWLRHQNRVQMRKKNLRFSSQPRLGIR